MSVARPLAVLTALALASCQRDEDPADPAQEESVVDPGPVVAEVAKDYKSLIKITPKPVQVNLNLATLCRGMVKRDLDEARATHGPHAFAAISVYMNEPARTAMMERTYAYPEGSIIVKAKSRTLGLQLPSGDPPEETGLLEDGVGGMIKRAAGSSPESGDWEFFYTEGDQPVEAGPIASCVECHGKVAKMDWVFGTWALQEFFE